MHSIVSSCSAPTSDPREFNTFKKVTIVFFVILAGAIPGLSSTIYFPGLPEITTDLHASSISVTASTSLFIFFQGIFPIIWSSLSDYFRIRKIIYIATLALFALASLGACFVQDIWVLVVMRCLQAAGASATTLGAGTISDLYPVEKRGTAMGLLFFGIYMGPLIGPNIGGGLTFHWSWRATFWFCFIYATTALIGMTLFTVDTYRPQNISSPTLQPSASTAHLELDKSVEMAELGKKGEPPTQDVSEKNTDNTNTGNTDTENKVPQDNETNAATLSTTPTSASTTTTPSPTPSPTRSFNPFQALLFLRYRFVYLTSLSMGVAFGVMFTYETILPDLFQEVYNLNSWQIGLCYLGGGAGNIIGSILGGRYIDYVLVKRSKARGRVLPEDRFTILVFISGFIIQPFGLLLFSWGVAHHLNLGAPIVGFGLVCFGMTQILLAGSTYLVDATGKGASATAAANCVRNVFACILSFVASPMVQHISVGYIGVLAAGLSWIVTALLLVNKIRGEKWREMAGFTKTPL